MNKAVGCMPLHNYQTCVDFISDENYYYNLKRDAVEGACEFIQKSDAGHKKRDCNFGLLS